MRCRKGKNHSGCMSMADLQEMGLRALGSSPCSGLGVGGWV